MRKRTYALWDRGKFVREGTAQEIADELHYTRYYIRQAFYEERTIGGRWQITQSGADPPKEHWKELNNTGRNYVVRDENEKCVDRGKAGELAKRWQCEQAAIYMAERSHGRFKGHYRIAKEDKNEEGV